MSDQSIRLFLAMGVGGLETFNWENVWRIWCHTEIEMLILFILLLGKRGGDSPCYVSCTSTQLSSLIPQVVLWERKNACPGSKAKLESHVW